MRRSSNIDRIVKFPRVEIFGNASRADMRWLVACEL